MEQRRREFQNGRHGAALDCAKDILIKHLALNHTVLISTRILSEVEMTASRVIIIDGGKIKAADTPQNLISEMRAAGRIQVELQAPAETATPILAELPHVKKVSSGTCAPIRRRRWARWGDG